MKKISIGCSRLIKKIGLEDALALIKRSGFDAVNFELQNYYVSTSPYFGSDDEFESCFRNIKKVADDLELEIAHTHGMCGTFMPDNETHNNQVVKLTKKDLHATSLLGAPSCVVHFINSSRWDKQPPELMHRICGEMYDSFIPAAEKYKVNIAMETFGAARIKGARIRDFFSDPVEFKRQYERLDTKYKTICVDTGHTNLATNMGYPSVGDVIRYLGDLVEVLHMHDNNGIKDQHKILGTGIIDWKDVFAALDEIGYAGYYNLETMLKHYGDGFEEAEAEFSAKVLKHMLKIKN